MELLLGCGASREKRVWVPGLSPTDWEYLTTLDMDAGASPDVVFNLDRLHFGIEKLPFAPDTFDEVHAYEVLEHVGYQGEWRGFFREFSEFWRILKPGGLFCATVPAPSSPWLWGDPGHRRALTPDVFTFLVQPEYDKEGTMRTDYRAHYQADFDLLLADQSEQAPDSSIIVLRAVKPSRCST